MSSVSEFRHEALFYAGADEFERRSCTLDAGHHGGDQRYLPHTSRALAQPPRLRHQVGEVRVVEPAQFGASPHHGRGAHVPALGTGFGDEHSAGLSQPVPELGVFAEGQVPVEPAGREVEVAVQRHGGTDVYEKVQMVAAAQLVGG